MLIALALAAAALPAATNMFVIRLNQEDSVKLVNDLERELGGKFLLVGLADAERTCRSTGACFTRSALAQQATSNEKLLQATNLTALLSASRVNSAAPKHAVAVRYIRNTLGGIRVTASVFDVADQRWRLATADIREVPVGGGVQGLTTRKLQSWKYLPD